MKCSVNISIFILVTQSESDRSCICLVRLQQAEGTWLWCHTVIQLREAGDTDQNPNILCTHQILRYVGLPWTFKDLSKLFIVCLASSYVVPRRRVWCNPMDGCTTIICCTIVFNTTWPTEGIRAAYPRSTHKCSTCSPHLPHNPMTKISMRTCTTCTWNLNKAEPRPWPPCSIP